MEALTKVSWGLLALVHAPPALVLLIPSLTQRLYGLPADGEAGLLLIHRGALFAAVIAACVMAMLDPSLRRAMSVIVAVSVIGFLFTYWRGGMPAGSLRTIAIMDVIALAPLAFVALRAWRG